MVIHRNIRLLAWFNFWSEFRPYAPISILYFSQVSGSYALGMSVFSISMLAQSLFEVPTGVISDRVGRRRTVISGAVAGVLSLLCYAIAGSAIGGSYLILLAGGIFAGLARAFYSGNNEALLYDTLTEAGQQAHYQEYLGKTSSTFEIALAVSAMIGSLIAAISFGLVMWLSVIPMGLALLTGLRLSEPRVSDRHEVSLPAHLRIALQKILSNPKLRTISLASILSFALGESAWLFRSAFIALLWPVWALGLAQLIANAGAAVSFYFAGRIIRRVGEFRLLVGGMLINEATNLFALAIPTVFSPLLISLSSAFYGVNTVAISSLMQREFTDEQRATMGSLTSLAGSIVFALFSYLLGALADRIGVIPALMTVSLLSIVPMLLYGFGLREPKSPPLSEIVIEVGREG